MTTTTTRWALALLACVLLAAALPAADTPALPFGKMLSRGNVDLMLGFHSPSLLRQMNVPGVPPDARDGLQVLLYVHGHTDGRELEIAVAMRLKDGTRVTASRAGAFTFQPQTAHNLAMQIALFDYGPVDYVESVTVRDPVTGIVQEFRP
jgi:hypothetical protein